MITNSVQFGWIDIFFRKKYQDVIMESLKYCQENKGFQVFGYVILTNHVHLIVNAIDQELLSTVIGNLKIWYCSSIRV